MSTLQLENIKHPDASGNALELGADGSIVVSSVVSLVVGNTGNGPITDAWNSAAFKKLEWNNTLYQNSSVIGTSAEGPNKAVWYNDTSAQWVSGIGISDHTTNYYSGGRHRFSRHYGDVITEHMRIDENGYVTMPKQLHISGTPHSGAGDASSGIATVFYTRTTPRGLSFSNNRITVPVAGVYMITWQTIASNSSSGRWDSNLRINGINTTNGLSEDNGSGYHQRTHSISIYLSANDYIQFNHAKWYNSPTGYDDWNTASVTLLG